MYRCLSKFSNSVSLQVSITVRVIPKAWSEPSNEAEAKHVAELLLRILPSVHNSHASGDKHYPMFLNT